VRGVDLTYARSAVRPLTPPYLCQIDFPRRVGHVGEPVVRGREDVTTKPTSVISFFPPGRPSRGAQLGANSVDLTERVNSCTNPGDLAEKANSGRVTSSDSSSSVRVVSSPRSGEASQCDPEVGSPGASSGPRLPVNARVLRGLEVMKAYHDLDMAVTEGSLAVIRECLGVQARLVGTPDRQCLLVLIRGGIRPGRHKSRLGEEGSRSRSKGKEPAAPSEEPDMPVEPEEAGASPVHRRPRSMKDLFKTKIEKDDAGYYTLLMSDLGYQDPEKEMKARWKGLKNSTKVWNNSSAAEEFERGLLHPQLARELYTLPSEAVAKADGRASELQEELEKTRRERDETLRRHEASEKELHKVQSNLDEAHWLLKEARVRARKMNDELLQSMKALESARAELPRQTVVQYIESLGLQEGLKRMSQVTYEYGYQVALARFHARHPDAEVEEDPFTIHPEDDLVSMEWQQTFDDSVPPEP
ncbi:hypothetical protein B296_00036661, partial [Ensete ventricosum]